MEIENNSDRVSLGSNHEINQSHKELKHNLNILFSLGHDTKMPIILQNISLN